MTTRSWSFQENVSNNPLQPKGLKRSFVFFSVTQVTWSELNSRSRNVAASSMKVLYLFRLDGRRQKLSGKLEHEKLQSDLPESAPPSHF